MLTLQSSDPLIGFSSLAGRPNTPTSLYHQITKKHLIMKKGITIIAAIFLSITSITAQESMDLSQAISQLRSADSVERMIAAAQQFRTVQVAEEDIWLAMYYPAYALAEAGHEAIQTDSEQAIALLDEAEKLAKQSEKATSNAKAKSELAALQAYIILGRVRTNPLVHGRTYMGVYFLELDKAQSLDPNNPRAAYLKGLFISGMPAFAGGGKAPATPHVEHAIALYEASTASETWPAWGNEETKTLYASLIDTTGK